MSSKIRLHLIAPPHTVCNKSDEMMTDAFGQTLINFAVGMKEYDDFELIHYGHKDSDKSLFHDHVAIVDNNDFKKAGYFDYDRSKESHRYDKDDHVFKSFMERADAALKQRVKSSDFILPFGGWHKSLYSSNNNFSGTYIDPSIGHFNAYTDYKVFVSHAVMNNLYGVNQGYRNLSDKVNEYLESIASWKLKSLDLNNNGALHDWSDLVAEIKKGMQIDDYSETSSFDLFNPRWCDAVINCPIDFDDFKYVPSNEKEDYFLFMARMQYDKGIELAVRVAIELGKKLIIMGQGDPEEVVGWKFPKNVEVLGRSVGIEERAEYMSKAKLSFVPSFYSEPFGMVVPENGASGTPVLTTDWGAFAETVKHGVNGYRCRRFEEFCWAADNISNIKSEDCYRFASQFRLQVAAKKYNHYFKSVRRYLRRGNKQERLGDTKPDKSFWYNEGDVDNLDWLNEDMIDINNN